MNNKSVFNKIPIEDISIGMDASYSRPITKSDIQLFADVSGDRNPIHTDERYAKKSRYGKNIAHGLMTASYFSALFGTKIPGEGSVYVSQSLRFKRPVYVGDIVEATVVVTSVELDKRRVHFKTVCKVGGKIVTDGEAEICIPSSKSKSK
jgi:acyl dehydratase